jgi:hypothetical protein
MHARHTARLGELDELTILDAGCGSNLHQDAGNHRVEPIEVNAGQLCRQRHGELRDALELGFGPDT